jgi:hypothetical protein
VDPLGQAVAGGAQGGGGVGGIEAAQDLVQEQRVAGRLAGQPGRGLRLAVAHRPAQRLAHELAHVVDAQAGHVDAVQRAPVLQRHDPAQRAGALDVAVAHGQDQ